MKLYVRIFQVLLITGVGILFFFLNPAEHHIFPECVFHSTTGYYCPGCGSQRAIYNLLHLNIAGVVGNNLLFIPAGWLILYHYFHPFFNRKFRLNLPNIFHHEYTPWVIFVAVILFWIARNLQFFPFSVLAPG